jgi:hypothetical protein
VSSVCRAQSKPDPLDYPFKLGEKLEYTMSYGWFEIGKADVEIDHEFWMIDHKPYFYVQCRVKTAGFFSFFAKLNVCMDSWVDAQTLLPLQSSRDLSHGNKIDIRTDRFDYQDSVHISAYVEDVDSHRFHSFPSTDIPILDVLSTYLYLRHKGCDQNNGEALIPVRTFFSNDLYSFGMLASMNKTITLHDQRFLAQRYELLFPETDEFPSGKQAYVLASKDSLCLPLKLSIEMRYGDFTFDLVDHQLP